MRSRIYQFYFIRNKRQLREERKRYTIFKNSKNCSNLGETFKSGSMVNTADIVPPTPTRPERRSTPKSYPPTNQAEEETNIDNNDTKSHKQRCSVAKKQPIRNYPASAESEDVFDTENDEQEKLRKKGRRRKERKRTKNRELKISPNLFLRIRTATTRG